MFVLFEICVSVLESFVGIFGVDLVLVVCNSIIGLSDPIFSSTHFIQDRDVHFISEDLSETEWRFSV